MPVVPDEIMETLAAKPLVITTPMINKLDFVAKNYYTAWLTLDKEFCVTTVIDQMLFK